METRSYSLQTIKSVNDKTREITGTMSTPETDRVGDQVLPGGMVAKLPAPCLWQHDHGDPIGEIVWVDAQKDGIKFRAKLAQVDSPPSLKEKFDSYFELIRRGLVKGISIGFRPLEMEPIATGFLIRRWELLEASVVTIPANASCTIQSVKAYAQQQGRPAEVKRPGVVSIGKPFKLKKIHVQPKWTPGDPIRIPRSGPRVVTLGPDVIPSKSSGPHRVVKLTQDDIERGKRRASTVVVKLGRR